jgi:hypothetical protein
MLPKDHNKGALTTALTGSLCVKLSMLETPLPSLIRTNG